MSREYVRGIMSMTRVEVSAAFGTNVTSVPGQGSGSGTQAVRSSAPPLASVLRSLTPTERWYVLGIAELALAPGGKRAPH